MAEHAENRSRRLELESEDRSAGGAGAEPRLKAAHPKQLAVKHPLTLDLS